LEQTIFHHMEAIRGITLKTLKGMPKEITDIVPTGFNNSIHWNFGHIAFIQEKLVYAVVGEEMSLPSEFEVYFGAGTKPTDWIGNPPTLSDISLVLAEQSARIITTHKGNLHKKLPTPFTNRGGTTFNTLGETLLYSFYHESLHLETIKIMRRLIMNAKS